MLRPIGDRVIVEVEKKEEKTAGGIVLPDAAQEKPQKGKIVAVGEGKILDDGSRGPMEVKVGDTVIFSKYGGTEVKQMDRELVILRQDDIYAIETPDALKKAIDKSTEGQRPRARTARRPVGKEKK